MQILINKKALNQTLLLAAASFGLGGCVVGAAVDLAATTVLTAGKIAVKTTGAVVDAVIPDKDDDDKKNKKQQTGAQQPADQGQYQPVGAAYQPVAPNPQPSQSYPPANRLSVK